CFPYSLIDRSAYHLFFFLLTPPPPRSTLFPYTTLFRSQPSRDIETVKPIPGGDEDLSHGWPKTLRDAYRGTLLTCIAGRSSCQVWVVSTPNSPWLSSSIPAVKKSELLGPLLVTPPPNAIAQRPSMVIGRLSALRSWPRNSPVAGSTALMRPSPKLPTRRSP